VNIVDELTRKKCQHRSVSPSTSGMVAAVLCKTRRQQQILLEAIPKLILHASPALHAALRRLVLTHNL